MKARYVVALVLLSCVLYAPLAAQDAKAIARGWINANADTIKHVNKSIWTYAETGAGRI